MLSKPHRLFEISPVLIISPRPRRPIICGTTNWIREFCLLQALFSSQISLLICFMSGNHQKLCQCDHKQQNSSRHHYCYRPGTAEPWPQMTWSLVNLLQNCRRNTKIIKKKYWLGQSHSNSFLTPGVEPMLTRNSLASLKQSSMLICAGSTLQFSELQKWRKMFRSTILKITESKRSQEVRSRYHLVLVTIQTSHYHHSAVH